MTAIQLKAELRRKMRQQRSSLNGSQIELASRLLAKQAMGFVPLLKAKRITSYRAVAGEIDAALLEVKLSAEIYLPRITNLRLREMRFYRQAKHGTIGSYGISEPPQEGQPLVLSHCDVVLVPLVAFQRDGTRLGMGAGFYDRALAFRQFPGSPKRPLLVGLAHSFQETSGLQAEPWDVPLDAIITDREIITV